MTSPWSHQLSWVSRALLGPWVLPSSMGLPWFHGSRNCKWILPLSKDTKCSPWNWAMINKWSQHGATGRLTGLTWTLPPMWGPPSNQSLLTSGPRQGVRSEPGPGRPDLGHFPYLVHNKPVNREGPLGKARRKVHVTHLWHHYRFFLSPLLCPRTLSHKLTQVWELSTTEFKSRFRPRPLLLTYIFMSVYKSNRPQWTAIWFSFQEPHDQLTTAKTSDEQTDPSAYCVHFSSSSDCCVWLPASDLQGHFPLPLWLAVLQINQCPFSDRGYPFAFWAKASVNQQEKY